MGQRAALFFMSLSPAVRALWVFAGFQVLGMIIRASLNLG
jgi:hypothetical protein